MFCSCVFVCDHDKFKLPCPGDDCRKRLCLSCERIWLPYEFDHDSIKLYVAEKAKRKIATPLTPNNVSPEKLFGYCLVLIPTPYHRGMSKETNFTAKGIALRPGEAGKMEDYNYWLQADEKWGACKKSYMDRRSVLPPQPLEKPTRLVCEGMPVTSAHMLVLKENIRNRTKNQSKVGSKTCGKDEFCVGCEIYCRPYWLQDHRCVERRSWLSKKHPGHLTEYSIWEFWPKVFIYTLLRDDNNAPPGLEKEFKERCGEYTGQLIEPSALRLGSPPLPLAARAFL